MRSARRFGSALLVVCTFSHRADSESGKLFQVTYVADGTGFYYKTPRRTWMTDAFEGP